MSKGRTNKQGGASVSLTGDAVVAEVLNSKTFYNTDPNTKLTGTMPNKVGSATVITPSTSDQTIPQGYYGGASGDGKVIGDADLISANIKSGANIFGVSGNSNVVDTSSGDAVAGEILSNKKAWVAGAEITGSMANNGAYNITPGTSNQSIPAGYHNGSGVVYGDSDLVASNIKSGVNIFGIDGSYNGATTTTTILSISFNFTDRLLLNICGSEDGMYVFAISRNGSTYYIDVSTDGGETWTNRYTGSIAWTFIMCSRLGDKILVVTNNSSTTVQVSTNYGTSFSSVTVSASVTSMYQPTMSDDGTIMYIQIFNGSAMQMFKSTNSGASFSQIGLNNNVSQINSMDCSSDGSILFASLSGYSQVKKSTDGGATWGTSLGYAYAHGSIRCNAAGDSYVSVANTVNRYYKNVSGTSTNIGPTCNSPTGLQAFRDLSYILGADTTSYLTSYRRIAIFPFTGSNYKNLDSLSTSGYNISNVTCPSRSFTTMYAIDTRTTPTPYRLIKKT